jgi:endonuclease G, mitochondrial
LVEGLERFEPDTFQVTVEEIIQRTGLNFSQLIGSQFDIAGGEGLERTDEGRIRRRLTRVSQVLL